MIQSNNQFRKKKVNWVLSLHELLPGEQEGIATEQKLAVQGQKDATAAMATYENAMKTASERASEYQARGDELSGQSLKLQQESTVYAFRLKFSPPYNFWRFSFITKVQVTKVRSRFLKRCWQNKTGCAARLKMPWSWNSSWKRINRRPCLSAACNSQRSVPRRRISSTNTRRALCHVLAVILRPLRRPQTTRESWLIPTPSTWVLLWSSSFHLR